MKEVTFRSTEVNTYASNSRATAIGQPVVVSNFGLKYTHIVYSYKISAMKRLAELVKAFAATVFTLFFGLVSHHIREAWYKGLIGKELVHVIKESGIEQVSDDFFEKYETLRDRNILLKLKIQVAVLEMSNFKGSKIEWDTDDHFDFDKILSNSLAYGKILVARRLIEEYAIPYKIVLSPRFLHRACVTNTENPYKDEIAYRLVKMLLQLGMDVNYRKRDRTALSLALENDHIKTAAFLLRHGATHPSKEILKERPHLAENYEKARHLMMTENEVLFKMQCNDLPHNSTLPVEIVKHIFSRTVQKSLE